MYFFLNYKLIYLKGLLRYSIPHSGHTYELLLNSQYEKQHRLAGFVTKIQSYLFYFALYSKFHISPRNINLKSSLHERQLSLR